MSRSFNGRIIYTEKPSSEEELRWFEALSGYVYDVMK